MVTSAYRYVLDLLRPDGTRAGQASIEVDWDTAGESARFLALRRGRLCGGAGGARPAAVAEPIWHPALGAPYVSGVRVTRAGGCEDPVASDLSTAYFQSYAQVAFRQLVEKGRLEAGDRVVYLASAYARSEAQEEPEAGADVQSEDVSPSLALPPACLDAAGRDAVPVGTPDADDVPVFVPEDVLDEAAQLAHVAGADETGGILIGHVHRDSGEGDLFVRVTAQIPARHAEASTTRLTFTAATWTDARAALSLRHRGEVMLGWWHSHPVHGWCKGCPPERQRVCRLARDFFSEHDRALHRTVFDAAYCVALVVNHGVGSPTFSMFGWRRGLVESRAFGVTGISRPAAFATHALRLESGPCSQLETATRT